MRRPRGRIQYSWQRRSFGVAPDRKSVFWTVDAVTGPGWHRGRQGTEWYRVPLESEQKRAPYPWVFQAVSSPVLVLIDGPDFDCVSVTVWPARCGSLPLGVKHCDPARLFPEDPAGDWPSSCAALSNLGAKECDATCRKYFHIISCFLVFSQPSPCLIHVLIFYLFLIHVGVSRLFKIITV